MVSHSKSLAEEFCVGQVHADCEEGEPKHDVPHLARTAAIVVSRRCFIWRLSGGVGYSRPSFRSSGKINMCLMLLVASGN